jgi:hypothetical protein
MIPHPIRLRHPWDELPGDLPGSVVYRRVFNQPTGLDTWERVSLEVDRTIFSGEILLNGQSIGNMHAGQFFSADITQLLQPSNELHVKVAPPITSANPNAADANSQLPPSHSAYIVDPNEPLGSPIGDVRLLIRSVHPTA